MSTYISNTLERDDTTVAQLAISRPGALGIFEKYNIDYCCGGHRSLEEACQRIGLDPARIRQEIYQSTDDISQVLRTERWSSSMLIDFIIQNHHGYVTAAIPEIRPYWTRSCAAHGNDCLELLTVREAFLDLAEELTGHMKKEEFVLFPAIKRLESQSFDDHPLAGAIQSPISAMEHEHDSAGNLIKQIRSATNNYTPPDFRLSYF
jgi:regulator of cell morphogenesis and NO signaling